jgi:hypothetical protein
MIGFPYMQAGVAFRENTADPIYEKNVLLLDGIGANAGTSFPDRSSFARTVTANGNVQTSTAQAKIGASSILFDGAGDYLTTPYSAVMSGVSTGDFTVEMWFRPTSQTADQTLAVYALTGVTTGAEVAFGIVFFGATALGGSTRKVRAFALTGTTQTSLDSTTLLSAATWYHIAFTGRRVQSSGSRVFYLHIGGAMEATAASITMNVDTSHQLRIGRYETTTTRYVDGHIGPWRMSVGRARYDASNFTPPLLPFPNF